jgi:hypothetical protein
MLWIKPITKPRHTSCDLVELYALLTPICDLWVSFMADMMWRRGRVKVLEVIAVGMYKAITPEKSEFILTLHSPLLYTNILTYILLSKGSLTMDWVGRSEYYKW